MSRLELDRSLVLNKGWQPITTVNLRKALMLVTRDRAKIVDPETYEVFTWEDWLTNRSVDINSPIIDDGYIRTASFLLQKPEIITLSKFTKFPDVRVPFSRRGVYERDNFQCQYCKKFLRKRDCTLDHVIPVSKDGPTNWTNCVLSCLSCNQKKANRTPVEAGMLLNCAPARPTGRQLILKGVNMKPAWSRFLGDEYQEHSYVETEA